MRLTLADVFGKTSFMRTPARWALAIAASAFAGCPPTDSLTSDAGIGICDCLQLFDLASGADRDGPLLCTSPEAPIDRDLTLVVKPCFCAAQQCSNLTVVGEGDLSAVSVTSKEGNPLGDSVLPEGSEFVVTLRYAPTAPSPDPSSGETRSLMVTGTCTYQPMQGNRVRVRVLSVESGSCPAE